jgi:5-methylcytosine-specific restriction endonuclease McrA
MKTKITNAAVVWKQLEDVVVPRMCLSTTDRAIYSHLLRHSHLEGRRRLRFSILWLSRGTRLSLDSARQAVRRLIDQDALRLIERSKTGHVVEVRLPGEIRGAGIEGAGSHGSSRLSKDAELETTDFLQSRGLRAAIHGREGGRCFYCLRQIPHRVRCLDHVVPRVQKGRNGYRNLVSCCMECNAQKGESAAADFLRRLYRERRLTSAELTQRLRALDALAAGKLRPVVSAPSDPLSLKGSLKGRPLPWGP